MSGMQMQVDVSWLIGQFVAIVIVLFGALWRFSTFVASKISEHAKTQDERIATIEKDFNEHKARMPLEYQRREDAIRFETVLNGKLDAIYNLIERLRER